MLKFVTSLLFSGAAKWVIFGLHILKETMDLVNHFGLSQPPTTGQLNSFSRIIFAKLPAEFKEPKGTVTLEELKATLPNAFALALNIKALATRG